MINAIIGDVVRVQEGEVILRSGYVEYTLSVSAQTASKLSNLSLEEKKAVRLLTVLVHREDSMSLFGFSDEAERGAFLQLQTVSGIGSKQALKILSGISVKHLAEALDTGNLKLLSSIPGIGPKTGQKMILALRNVLVFEDEGLKAGMQKLNGHDALAYVRWRDDGRGDIGRIERQQKFFKALSSQALSFSTVWKIPDLLQELNKHVKTDMKVQKMLQIANRFKDLDNIEITTYMVPGVPDDVNYGASYWIADEQALQDVLEKIYDQKSKNDSTGLAKK